MSKVIKTGNVEMEKNFEKVQKEYRSGVKRAMTMQHC